MFTTAGPSTTVQSCLHGGGGGIWEDMCYERRRAEACTCGLVCPSRTQKRVFILIFFLTRSKILSKSSWASNLRGRQMPLRAWMVVGSMRMPEKPSLLASWMNAKRGSVGSKVCRGASRATATFQIIFNASSISHVLCERHGSARDRECARERERESARARTRALASSLPSRAVSQPGWRHV
jgi:hypothetical protein